MGTFHRGHSLDGVSTHLILYTNICRYWLFRYLGRLFTSFLNYTPLHGLLDLAQQLCRSVRLVQEEQPLLLDLVQAGPFVCVAAEQDRLKRRLLQAQPVNQLDPLTVRQDGVTEQQVPTGAWLPEGFAGLDRRPVRPHCIAVLRQQAHGQGGHVRIILHQQDALSATQQTWRGDWFALDILRLVRQDLCRQVDPKRAAGAGKAFHIYPSLVSFHDSVSNRQTESGPFARLFRSEKGLENV